MGLLDKTNPLATRESVIRWAIGWGVLSVVVLLSYFAWSPPQNPDWPWLVVLAGIAGAFLGGLMEWQPLDGLELYELMLDVDEEFTITLPKEEECDTVGELYEMILVKLREKSGAVVDEEAAWNRLKTLLVKQLGVKTEKVVPAARFYIDIHL